MSHEAGDDRPYNDEAAYIVTRRRSAPTIHMKIEEQITLYPELSEEERSAVEVYVDAHPEWKPALDEAKRWDELLHDVRLLGREPPGDEALAYYVVTRGLQPARAPEEVAEFMRQVEEQIESDPALAALVARMESRLNAAQEASPASAQFERLTRRVRSVPKMGAPFEVSEQPGSAEQGRHVAGKPVEEFARDGDSRIFQSSDSHVWRLLAAVIATVALYGILYTGGQLARPLHERLAQFNDEELSLEGFSNVRGSESADETRAAVISYLNALEQLRGAETSFIGLFPTFDKGRLDSAAALLNSVIRIEPSESFLAGEAAFLLGKTELARGNIDAASQAFSRVIAAGGRKAPEASRILADLGS